MPDLRASAPLLLASLLLLSGCASPSGPAASDPDAVAAAAGTAGWHEHDLWGDAARLVIVDEAKAAMALNSGRTALATFLPADGVTIPQGTAFVEVTVTWTSGPLDRAEPPELWVKTAADDGEGDRVAPLRSGETLVVPSTNRENDLPHLALSAWVFHVMLPAQDSPAPQTYYGDVALKAEAVRGLPIPEMPVHPDHWQGLTELQVLDLTHTTDLHQPTPAVARSICVNCEPIVVLDNGSIVPPGTSRLDVAITHGGQDATRLALRYHGADSRTFVDAPLVSDSGAVRVFSIPVDVTTADGAYSLQSQWEFELVPATAPGVQAGPYSGSYTLVGTAYR